jgi:hypothetical protein
MLGGRTAKHGKKRFPKQRETVMNSFDKNPLRYGIRVSVAATDPFAKLVGDDWQTTHWYPSQLERDRALRDMQRVHEYSRSVDKPTLQYETLNQSPEK